jgi:SAM-dependent methyltransferase
MSQDWNRYYDAAAEDPRRTLLLALEGFGDEHGFAVDLGCGTGRDTVELLRRGWRVLAIDGQPEAIDRLSARIDGHGRLRTQVASFEDAVWPLADLVNASFALPFCPPEAFEQVWQRIVDSLGAGGRFSGQLFGDRDGWVGTRPITFLAREEVERLLRGFELELFEEIEEDGATVVGELKHWHLFHVVARKR